MGPKGAFMGMDSVFFFPVLTLSLTIGLDLGADTGARRELCSLVVVACTGSSAVLWGDEERENRLEIEAAMEGDGGGARPLGDKDRDRRDFRGVRALMAARSGEGVGVRRFGAASSLVHTGHDFAPRELQ